MDKWQQLTAEIHSVIIVFYRRIFWNSKKNDTPLATRLNQNTKCSNVDCNLLNAIGVQNIQNSELSSHLEYNKIKKQSPESGFGDARYKSLS